MRHMHACVPPHGKKGPGLVCAGAAGGEPGSARPRRHRSRGRRGAPAGAGGTYSRTLVSEQCTSPLRLARRRTYAAVCVRTYCQKNTAWCWCAARRCALEPLVFSSQLAEDLEATCEHVNVFSLVADHRVLRMGAARATVGPDVHVHGTRDQIKRPGAALLVRCARR